VKSNKRRTKVAKNIRSWQFQAKIGCPTENSDHKLTVPINYIGENNEHVKQFKNG